MALDTTRTFSQPVDAALVPDYYTVVKKPMDLSRMRQRAERYEAARDMRPDIDLIVANALYYNGAQSPIAQAAVNLKNGWLECCLKCELQEKALLKATPTTPTSPTFSTSLSFVLVALAVVLATPALYAQLLRAVYQRVVFLLSNSTMPSENNVLDPVLFAYYQLLTLPDHLDELVARTAGKSSFFPQGLFAAGAHGGRSDVLLRLFAVSGAAGGVQQQREGGRGDQPGDPEFPPKPAQPSPLLFRRGGAGVPDAGVVGRGDGSGAVPEHDETPCETAGEGSGKRVELDRYDRSDDVRVASEAMRLM